MNPAIALLAPGIFAVSHAIGAPFWDGWSNQWAFIETWKGLSDQTESVVYNVKIYSINRKRLAQIDLDGHMTLCRVLARVEMNSGQLNFYFIRARKGHTLPTFKRGDLLFSLQKCKGQIITHWSKLEPTLEENLKPGVYLSPSK